MKVYRDNDPSGPEFKRAADALGHDMWYIPATDEWSCSSCSLRVGHSLASLESMQECSKRAGNPQPPTG